MVKVTKLNDVQIVINCDFIEEMKETPDTTITLTTGKKIIVKETVDEIIDEICEYKRKIR